MLRAEPTSWFWWNYDVLEDARHLGTLELDWFGGCGSFELDGQEYRIERSVLYARGWVLRAKGEAICHVSHDLGWGERFRLDFSDQHFILKQTLLFHTTFVLQQDGATVGTIRLKGMMCRKVLAELPESLPRSIQVFLLSLVLRWRITTGSLGATDAEESW